MDDLKKSMSSEEISKPDAPSELTYGQKAVGITFNPGGMPQVNKIKELSAALIDELHNQIHECGADTISARMNFDKMEMFKLSIQKIQEGQMWGVKATTWQY